MEFLKNFITNKNNNNIITFLYVFCISGVNTFAYAPFNHWYIIFLTLPLFFVLVDHAKSYKQISLYAYAFGMGWFTWGLSWVKVGMDFYEGTPFILIVLFLFGLFSLLSLVPILTCLVFYKYKKEFGLFIFVTAWSFWEWVRIWLLTGFPWLTLGYSQTESPLQSFAPIIGEIGLQVIVLLISLLIYKTFLYFNKKEYKKILVSISLIATIFVLAHFSEKISWIDKESKKEVTVTLIQPNISQRVKWVEGYEDKIKQDIYNMAIPHLKTSDVIVFSEATIPVPEANADFFLNDLNNLAFNNNSSIIFGIMNEDTESDDVYNSVIVLGKENIDDTTPSYSYNNENRYNKHHLLLLGEFVPFESLLRGILPLFDLPMSSLTKGDSTQKNIRANGFDFSPAICFEIVFPTLFLDNVYSDKEDYSTDFLLTIGNETWFGLNRGLWQHVQIAQMRAKEFQKPLLRSSNTGVTGFIDYNGNISESVPLFEEGYVTKNIEVYHSETFYQKYGRYPTYLFLALLTAIIYFRKNKLSHLKR